MDVIQFQEAVSYTHLDVYKRQAIESDDGTILNSNLLPVKAKGEVLFLSVTSFLIDGIVETPIVIDVSLLLLVRLPSSI